jgi:hypothetical protein
MGEQRKEGKPFSQRSQWPKSDDSKLQGCQMTSRRYVKALQDFGIKQERMSYNNPNADAYIGTLVPEAGRGDDLVAEILLLLRSQKRHRTIYSVLQ